MSRARLALPFSLVLAASSAACHWHSPAEPTEETAEESSLDELGFEPICQGGSLLAGRQRFVIEDLAEYRRLFPEVCRYDDEPPPVDFGSHRVIVVTQGARPNGCHGIFVERILWDGAEELAEVVELEDGRTCGCTAAIVSPSQMVSVERRGGVRYTEETRYLNCP